MPWTPMTTFTDGEYLSAARLNDLKENIEYLWGLVNFVNTGFMVEEIICDDNSYAVRAKWAVKHYTNTFRYEVEVDQGTIGDFQIYVFGNTSWNIFTDNTEHGAGYKYSGTADITSLGIVVGTVYDVYIRVRGHTGSPVNQVTVYYFGEDL